MARAKSRRPTRRPGGDRRASRRALIRWLVLAALLVCFVLLQRGLWFTTSGLPHGWHLGRQLTREQQGNAALKAANAQRWEEVKGLKRGKAAIEEHARMDLGLVKKGETFYQIVKAPASAAAAATAPAPGSGGT